MNELMKMPTVELAKEFTKTDNELDILEQKTLLLMQKRALLRQELIKRFPPLEEESIFKERFIIVNEDNAFLSALKVK